MRWLRSILRSEQRGEPFVKIADLLPEPEARMWQEALRQEGISALLKSLTAGAEPGYSLSDFSLWTRAEDSERAKEVVGGEASGDVQR